MPRRHLLVLGLLAVAGTTAFAAATAERDASLPERLSETGLFVAGTSDARESHLPFSPQYPLWSDGASKRRWIHLPPGTAIDATRPDAWSFPPGTRLWKEFGHARPVETRYMERLRDGSWRFATYVWTEDGGDALLAPERGTVLSRSDAPLGRYVVPSRQDCLACHEGSDVPVLGFSAVQLSPDRDPLAPHAEPRQSGHVDLARLVADGKLANFPAALLAPPPRIAGRSPGERAALGYLHANCGHCHDDAGELSGLDLALRQRVGDAASASRTLASLVGHGSRFRAHGSSAAQRIAGEASAESVLTLRMKTMNPLAKMPPLGVRVVDDEGVALVERWIRHDLQRPQGDRP